MSGWTLITVVLVAQLILLAILLLPMPDILKNSVISVLNKLQKPMYLLLIILTALVGTTTVDMWREERNYQELHAATIEGTTAPGLDIGKSMLLHNLKWRAERNFNLVAFAWALTAVLLRCHAVLSRELKLTADLNQLIIVHKALEARVGQSVINSPSAVKRADTRDEKKEVSANITVAKDKNSPKISVDASVKKDS
eukprot:TRINITY_DN1146_c0_g1_i1.p1 TRINITY_DN1146_c0_g1~~TRINITY_DN1146_c0_g1_i1.p1  ORF type:complete len:197 (-),score=47.57 TRINITY_DN1146_c0_g1_i1:65-655(-)